MTNEFRTVLDSNTVVSAAILPRSTPRRAFDAAIAHGRILISDDTIGELNDVLHRPRFDKYLSEEARIEYLANYVRIASLVEIRARIQKCRDPKDDKFLELAVCGSATHIVTGDADLLAQHPFEGIAI